MTGNKSRPTEAQLIAQADTVWQIVFRILGDQDDSRECYQQTFLDAMRLDLTHVRCLGAVMRQIATRRAMDLLRRKYRERDRVDLTEADIVTDQPPESEVMHKELCESVRKVLATLPENQAEAFWMRHIAKMSPAEIAESLRIQPGHVRVLVHRAVQELRQQLGTTYAFTTSGEKK